MDNEVAELELCALNRSHSTWGRKESYVQLNYDGDVTYSVNNVGDVLTVLMHFVQVLVECHVFLLINYDY